MKTLGVETVYRGSEHRYLGGLRVRIVAVLKGAAREGRDPDEDYAYLTDEVELARAGGVTADDRVEVQPWVEKEQRFSFVTRDPRAIDLELFAELPR